MRHIFHITALSFIFVFVTSGCLIKNAVEDLDDAIDDASKTDGQEACYDIMQDVFENLSGLDDCPNAPPIPEGETAESVGMAWCDDNCSALSDQVDYTDVTNCTTALYSLECNDLVGFVQGTAFPGSCSWMSNDLGC